MNKVYYFLIPIVIPCLYVGVRCFWALHYEHRKLQKEIADLKLSYEDSKELAENLMCLYPFLERFLVTENPSWTIRGFRECVKKLTGVQTTFLWLAPYQETKSEIVFTPEEFPRLEQVKERIQVTWRRFQEEKGPIIISLLDEWYLVVPVITVYRHYGLIGMAWDEAAPQTKKEQWIKSMIFLAELSVRMIERYRLEKGAGEWAVQEEQRRIADEIHDTVAQRLFSTACAAHVLKMKGSSMSDTLRNEQLTLVAESATQAAKELRSVVYRLERETEDNLFFKVMKDYFENFARLNQVQVNFNVDGDENLISSALKKACYRILTESTGNSVRHGECTLIKIQFSVLGSYIKLTICDNGKGFALSSDKSQGLGLYNMGNIAKELNGSLEILSELGEGTTISVVIPLYSVQVGKYPNNEYGGWAHNEDRYCG